MADGFDCHEISEELGDLNQSMKFRACFNSEGGSGKSLKTLQAIFVLGKTTDHIVIKIAKK